MRRRPTPRELLNRRVHLPAGHPEGWTAYPDALDEDLADLHDKLWPLVEWADVEDCPRLDLTPYETEAEARRALHQARRGGLRRRFWRVHPCACQAWHVGPWFLRLTPPRPGAGRFTALLIADVLLAVVLVADTNPTSVRSNVTVAMLTAAMAATAITARQLSHTPHQHRDDDEEE